MTEFPCNPTDFEQLPWAAGCQECTDLYSDPEPGLFTWVQAAFWHFQEVHQVTLVGA